MTNFKTYTKLSSKLNRVFLDFLFFCFILLLFYPSILSNISRPISIIILTIGLLGTISLFAIIVFFRNNNFIEGIVINGMIEFDEREVHFKGQSFSYSDLTDIHFFYAGYPKSKKQIHVYRTGNYLKFTLNQTLYKIDFLIENELERQKLVTLLKTLQAMGVKFKETTSQGASYFLDINLNYADIQGHKIQS